MIEVRLRFYKHYRQDPGAAKLYAPAQEPDLFGRTNVRAGRS